MNSSSKNVFSVTQFDKLCDYSNLVYNTAHSLDGSLLNCIEVYFIMFSVTHTPFKKRCFVRFFLMYNGLNSQDCQQHDPSPKRPMESNKTIGPAFDIWIIFIKKLQLKIEIRIPGCKSLTIVNMRKFTPVSNKRFQVF